MAQIIHDVDLPNTGDGDPLRTAFVRQNEMNTELYDTKVDKVTGQGLCENNFTDELKDKLDNIQEFSEVNVQSDWLQGDEDADDYIKNKPEAFVSYPYKAIFPFVDGNVFTMPDGVAVSDVRPNGSGSDIGWTQVGVTLTFTSYTLVADDFLVVIGFFNPANVFSPTSGSVQTITSNDLAIGVDDSDPENIVLSFGGVVTDGATINGSGTSLDPLVVIGGGGGSQSFEDVLQVNRTATTSPLIPNATEPTGAVNLQQLLSGSLQRTASDLPLKFDIPSYYGSRTTPLTGDIPLDITGAIIGRVQELYHSSPTPPVIAGTGITVIPRKTYQTLALNKIMLEYTEAGIVELTYIVV